MKIVLKSLALVYGSIIKLRNLGFDVGILPQHKAGIPVISIGNLTVGGTGKTPLVREVYRFLVQEGLRPVVVSRGYGGKLKGPVFVEDRHSPADVGDEPKMLQQCYKIPVVIARKRVLGAKLVRAQQLGDVIILDDGLQHRWLSRDLDIVTVDVSSPEAIRIFAEKKLLPEGRYRESFDSAIKRAGVIIFSTRTVQVPSSEFSLEDEEQLQVQAALSNLIPTSLPHVFSALKVDHEDGGELWVKKVNSADLSEGESHKSYSVGKIGKEIVAFCGIAQPEGFFESLRRLGFTIIASYRYPDHANFTQGDIERLLTKHPGVPLVCTRKDWVKLAQLNLEQALGKQVDSIYPLDVSAVLSGDVLWDRIREVLGSRQSMR